MRIMFLPFRLHLTFKWHIYHLFIVYTIIIYNDIIKTIVYINMLYNGIINIAFFFQINTISGYLSSF